MTRISNIILHTGALAAAFFASPIFSLSLPPQSAAQQQQVFKLQDQPGFQYPDSSLDSWLESERTYAFEQILANIGPDGANASGTAPGCILASPSKYAPNYYYQWIRDGGIVISTLVEQWHRGKWPNSQEDRILDKLLRVFMDYVDMQKNLQWTINPSGTFYGSGLGEPKFHVDGSAFSE